MDKQSCPGVMLYFDNIYPAMSAMHDEQFGRLIRAVIEYARTGEIIDLDQMGTLVFGMLRPKIDRDAERYSKKRLHSQYMAYCRRVNENERLSEEDWIVQLSVSDSGLSDTDSNYQTPTTDIDQAINTAINLPINTSAEVAGKVEGECQRGKGNPSPAKTQSIPGANSQAVEEQDFEKRRQAALDKLEGATR